MVAGLTTQPLGIMRKLYGIGPIEGVPDDFMLPSPTADGKLTAAQERAGPLLTQWRAGRAIVEGAGAQSLNFISSVRGNMGTGGMEHALSKLTSPKQRNLVTGLRDMSESYRFYVSGQQSAEKEAGRLMAILVPTDDKPETLRVKRFLWDVIDQAMVAASQGTATPTQTAQQILNAALSNRLPQATVKLLRAQLQDAELYEASAAYKLRHTATAPRDAVGGTSGFRDPVLQREFGTRP